MLVWATATCAASEPARRIPETAEIQTKVPDFIKKTAL
jgi:hypothetical protein